MTLEAVDKLKQSKTVSVFAPSGLWADEENKEEWIDALCDFEGEAIFVYGDAPENASEEDKKRILRRAKRLLKSGVEMVKIPAQEDVVSGFIIFDDNAICGYNDQYITITNYVEMGFLRSGFSGLLGVIDILEDYRG